MLPPNVSAVQRPMPARVARAVGASGDASIEWFIGNVDVVHGTNFVVPPTARAGAVVSVHDLTPLHIPSSHASHTGLSGAHTKGASARRLGAHGFGVRGGEVIEAFGADPARVRVVARACRPDGVGPRDDAGARPVVPPPGTGRHILPWARRTAQGPPRSCARLRSVWPSVIATLPRSRRASGWGEEALDAAIAGAGPGREWCGRAGSSPTRWARS